jgi:hypothetical protein
MGITRHAEVVAALRRSVLEAPGVTDTATRQRAFDGEASGDEGPLARYLAMVHNRSAYITDSMVEEARAAGASEDELFELTIAAATGEAFRRLDAGLRAMGVTE